MTSMTARGRALSATLLLLLPTTLAFLGTASATDAVACGTSAVPTEITAGVPVLSTDPSTASTDDCYFRLALTGDPTLLNLRVNLSGLTEDHNVFVKYGVAPGSTASLNDCFGTSAAAANEQCTVQWPLSNGDYLIRVIRNGTGSGSFTLTAFLDSVVSGCTIAGNPANGITTLTNATARSFTLDGAIDSKCVFQYTASGNMSLGDVLTTTLGSVTDPTMFFYVRAGSLPITSRASTTSATDCVPTSGARTCTTMNVAGRTVYAFAYRFSANATAASLSISGTQSSSCPIGPGINTLTEGQNVSFSLGTAAGARCYFQFAPSGTNSLANFTFSQVSGGLASLNPFTYIITQSGSLPTITPSATNVHCFFNLTYGNTCSERVQGNGVVYAAVWRAVGNTASTYTMKASSAEGCSAGSATTELADGSPASASLTNNTDAACFYHFAVDPAKERTRVTLSPSAGAFDLYMTKNASRPTRSVFDCRALTSAIGASTVCDANNTGIAELSLMTLRRDTLFPLPYSNKGPFTITAQSFDTCSLGVGDSVLGEATPLTATLTNDSEAVCFFRYTPLPGQSTVSLSADPAASGADVALYVKAGARPTTTSYDCLADGGAGGVLESCKLADAGQDLYAMIVRRSGSGSMAVAGVSYSSCSDGTGVIALADGVAHAASIRADALESTGCQYSFAPTAGVSLQRLSLTGGEGATLYLKKDAMPTTSSYDCATPVSGGSASCATQWEGASAIYGLVAGGSAASYDITAAGVEGCGLGMGDSSLTDGIDLAATLTGDRESACWFRFMPPPADQQTTLKITAAPATGDFDLYTKIGARPTFTDYDCLSDATGLAVAEGCQIPNTGEELFAMVLRKDGAGAVAVNAHAFSPCSVGSSVVPIEAGVPLEASLSADEGGACRFSFTVPIEHDATLVSLVPNADADFDLYLAKDTASSPTTYDCRSDLEGLGVAEECDLGLGSGTYNVTVTRIAGSGTFTLNAQPSDQCIHGQSAVALAPGVSYEDGMLAIQGAHCNYLFSVGTDHDTASVTLVPNAGAAYALYVKKDGTASAESHDCASEIAEPGAAQGCLDALGPGDYSVVASRISGAGPLSIVATPIDKCAHGIGAITLVDAVETSDSLLDTPGALCMYTFTVGSDHDVASVVLASGASGDNDLYVKKGGPATPSSFDCMSDLDGAGVVDACMASMGAGSYNVTVVRASGGGAFSLTASAIDRCVHGSGALGLGDGVPASDAFLDFSGGQCVYTFDVPSSHDAASLALDVPAGANYDLYVRKLGLASPSAFDCRSTGAVGVDETCDLAFDAGRYNVTVTRVSGGGAFSVTARSADSCSHGPAPLALAENASVTDAITSAIGGKCTYSFVQNSLSDVIQTNVTPSATSAFEVYARIDALPTTTTKTCSSIPLANASGLGKGVGCAMTLPDARSMSYMMVRPSANRTGNYTIVANSTSTCALGAGLHPMADGNATPAAFRAVAGAKCYFSLAPKPAADFVQFDLRAAAGGPSTITAATMYAKRGAVGNTTAYDCKGTASFINYPSLGLVIDTPAQCSALLNDSTPWYVLLSASTTGVSVNWTGQSMIIPTLDNRNLTQGHVDAAGTQYWKVVLPETATNLRLQTVATDPVGTLCQLGATSGSPQGGDVALACALLPLPALVGCAVIASQGLPATCGDLDRTFVSRCTGTGALDAPTCQNLFDTVLAAVAPLCAILAENGVDLLCNVLDLTYTSACTFLNSLSPPRRCAPSALDTVAVKPQELDLYVRYAAGLPNATVNDCASKNTGPIESCSFGEPWTTQQGAVNSTRSQGNGNLTQAIRILNENRTALGLDLLVAELQALLGENDPHQTLPATPGPQVPLTPGTAKPFPGTGRYFIAVKGPSSALLSQGGDYRIVALWDEPVA
ncbi:MAG TPA: hypothetical protein VM370_09455 [Candidatus Thermoplasmatota archaeon]|nr:hypothetical protein [Candidatus Thermoplasmatota archaeon]